MEKAILTVGYDKNGELDFGVNGLMGKLTLEELKDFRSMTITAIYIAEDIWRRNNEPKAQTNTI